MESLKRTCFVFLFLVIAQYISAQSVGIGTLTPNPKAILDVNSTNKGLLLPRLTDTSAVSVPVPAGLTIYSTSDKKVYFYDGTKWQRSSAQTASDGLWYERNDSILYTDRKYVGVNTNLGLLPPQANLQVNGSLLVQGNYTFTKAAPTPAQTYTMDNTLYQSVSASDSIFRIFDTGGSGNYINNTQGNISSFNPFNSQIALKISFNPSDFGIAYGDTLWISETSYPSCKTNYIQRYTNTSIPPNDLIVTDEFCHFIFRSNNSGVGPGFDITATRIYFKYGSNQAVNIIGNGFMYDGSKIAFRMGTPSNKPIGYFSTAIGIRTTASGSYSTAFGTYSTASGFGSTALGNSTIASSENSTAMGSGTQASGQNSTAMGAATIASGYTSTAYGYYSIASGESSCAMGRFTTAKSIASLALGRYNDTIVGANPTSWVSTDPILMVGNGSSDNERSNAMTVYKNGNTDISGFTRLGHLSEGAPRIKHKKITLNSPNSDGGIISTAHGLTYSKILSATAVLDYGSGSITNGYRYTPGFEFSLSYDVNLVYISNQSGNSASILNKPVKVLITYEE